MRLTRISLLFFLLFFQISSVFSSEIAIKKIKIEGNQRISSSYISNIVKNYIGKKITNIQINKITKELFTSDYFDDVLVNQNEETLVIKVIEKPIFSDFVFQGNELFEDEQLVEIINIKKRDTFNQKKIITAVNNIKIEYSKSGRYFAKVTVKEEKLSQSRVKLYFLIEEGEITKVNRINFVGNKSFSDSKLKGVISTKEASFFRIFGGSLFKSENIEIDKSKLKKFYKTRGYVDFTILSYRRDLLQDYSGFNINIIVDEGKKYKINQVSVSNNIMKLDKVDLTNDLTVKKGDYYDVRAVDESVKLLNDLFGEKGFSFVDVKANIKNKNKEKGLLDLAFYVDEGLKSYVRNINISGNTRTLDYVIRREILLFEGDPFNSQKLKQSMNAIRRLAYFSSADVTLSETSIPNEVDINIKVKEKLTGSFSFGIGYDSVEKTQFSVGLNENNFLGRGLKTRISFTSSSKSTKYNVGITQPYFQDLPLYLSGDIFDETIEQTDKDIDKSGFQSGIGFDRKGYFNKFTYSYTLSETKSTSTTATSTSGEEGIEIITSSIGYSVGKDTRDNFMNPSSGEVIKSKIGLAGVGGDAKFIDLQTQYKKYIPFEYGDYVLSFSGKVGMISSIDDEKVTSSNRVYFNSKSIRGFDSNGVGPRDEGNSIGVGGNKFYTGSVEMRTKKFTPEDLGIEIGVFTDFGSLWDTDYPTNVKGVDDSSPRITAGASVYWNTVVGPLSFIWAWPVIDESYDKENNFKFSIGTSF